MEVIRVWQVPALKTQDFRDKMKENKKEPDAMATLLNFCAGFNFFYETDKSYGDVSESAAIRISTSYNVDIVEF